MRGGSRLSLVVRFGVRFEVRGDARDEALEEPGQPVLHLAAGFEDFLMAERGCAEAGVG